jgi:hypothetical protein
MLRYIEFSAVPIHDPTWEESHARKGKAVYPENFEIGPVLEEILRNRGYRLKTEPTSTPADPEEVRHTLPHLFEKYQSRGYAISFYPEDKEEILP